MPPPDFSRLPRYALAMLPTPLEVLGRLSTHLGGPRIMIKRDDLTGLALGGNKTRKLEYLLGEAVAQRADTLLTAGAAQSNHCRQTAAAAARAGLHCDLVLGGTPPAAPGGNLLLDSLLGATLHWAGPDRRGERLEEVARDLRASGRIPYVIPYGGSNPLGAAAYVQAVAELDGQLTRFPFRPDAVVVASSSGATQAGLAAGFHVFGHASSVVGVRIDKEELRRESFAEDVYDLALRTLTLLGCTADMPVSSIRIAEDYVGNGYGVVGPLEREAIKLLARLEGILLDPVYTGRAMGGLMDMISRKMFSKNDTVLFWHTGGAPTLFAYASDLL